MTVMQYENAAPHTLEALANMRTLQSFEWYVIPLIGVIVYIFALEYRKARESQNWDPFYCVATIMGMVFLNETMNSWVAWISGVSAIWTTPGKTAFLIMFGINFEILCLFLLNGFTYYAFIGREGSRKILGIPHRWFWGLFMAGISVLTEHLLNSAGLLVWYWGIWDRQFIGFWLILWGGYFLFYLECIIVLRAKTRKSKLILIGGLYAIPVLMNIIAAIIGMVY